MKWKWKTEVVITLKSILLPMIRGLRWATIPVTGWCHITFLPKSCQTPILSLLTKGKSPTASLIIGIPKSLCFWELLLGPLKGTSRGSSYPCMLPTLLSPPLPASTLLSIIHRAGSPIYQSDYTRWRHGTWNPSNSSAYSLEPQTIPHAENAQVTESKLMPAAALRGNHQLIAGLGQGLTRW